METEELGDACAASRRSRREFVRLSSCGVVGLAGLLSDPASAIAAGPSAVQPVGVQLYTVRSLMAVDVAATLRAVSEIGYREVEFAGLFEASPTAMRRLLDDRGLTAVSSHVSLDRIRDDPSGVLDEARTLGLRYVTCPSVDRNELTREGLGPLADDFNRFGELASSRGLRFAYHNHDFEFREVDGLLPYDWLLERCDPDLVKMQMDVYWVAHAGQDPVAYLRSHPGRFPMIHAKDRAATGAMADVGAGTIDFGAILSVAAIAGTEHWVVEHDNPDDPLVSLRNSYEALSALGA